MRTPPYAGFSAAANTIAVFDLTDFYFDGRKEGSRKAQFDRSKEKRSDCKLLVPALCINKEGFIRYSSILARIKEKGYNYLCVSRQRLTNYELSDDMESVTVLDSPKREIKQTQVKHEEGGNYYLQIKSPGKALKEESMNHKFKEPFETELCKAKEALTKKGGKKAYERVIERVGRTIQKYPSIAKYYVIEYVRDKGNPKNMADIRWRIAVPDSIDKDNGIYFLLDYSQVPYGFGVCASVDCPKTSTCLRHIALEYAPMEYAFLPMLTPRKPATIKEGNCEYYRPNKTVHYACGFTRTLESLTVRVVDTFRWRLIARFGRKNYYLARKGEYLLKPADQKYIVSLAQELGLQADEYFDGYVDGYDWGD